MCIPNTYFIICNLCLCSILSVLLSSVIITVCSSVFQLMIGCANSNLCMQYMNVKISTYC